MLVSDEQTLPYSSSISVKELFWLRLLSVCHRMSDTDITNCPAVGELNIINPRFVFYISIGIYFSEKPNKYGIKILKTNFKLLGPFLGFSGFFKIKIPTTDSIFLSYHRCKIRLTFGTFQLLCQSLRKLPYSSGFMA